MKHFRDLLTTKSRLEYLIWRVLRRQTPLEIHFLQGERIAIRPLPAEDYGTAMEVFLDEVYKYPKPPSGTVQRIVDLGSNVGCSCVYWLRQFPSSHVTAFEPHPVHVDLLRSNLARNGLTQQVTVHHAAVGSRPGHALLTDQGLSSRVVQGTQLKAHKIEIVDFFAVIGATPIDILKIDIEGAEYELLSDERFASLPVRTIVMEWHPTEEHTGDSGAAWCREKLTSYGYTIEEHGGFRVLWAFRNEKS